MSTNNKLPVIGVIRMTRGSSTEIRRIQMTRAKRRQKEVATRRQRLYKDLGIKVFATREDSWVEIGGSSCYQNGNSS
jgi:hypothetical protein